MSTWEQPAIIAKQDQLTAGLRRRLTADGLNLDDPTTCTALLNLSGRIASTIAGALTTFAGDPRAHDIALTAIVSLVTAVEEITRPTIERAR